MTTAKPKPPSARKNAAKIDALCVLIDDIIDVLHLPVHEGDRLRRAAWKIRDMD